MSDAHWQKLRSVQSTLEDGNAAQIDIVAEEVVSGPHDKVRNWDETPLWKGLVQACDGARNGTVSDEEWSENVRILALPLRKTWQELNDPSVEQALQGRSEVDHGYVADGTRLIGVLLTAVDALLTAHSIEAMDEALGHVAAAYQETDAYYARMAAIANREVLEQQLTIPSSEEYDKG